MKTILPWLCALILLSTAIFFYSANRKLASEVAVLRDSETQAQSLRAELETIKANGTTAQSEEIAKLRKDTQELLRLRNEVRQLRDGNKELTQQVQRSQAQIEAARSQVQVLSTNLHAAQQSAAQQALAARASAQAAQQQNPAAVCINNLRQIDGAMQQWALENKKDASAVPTANEISAYLKEIPKCPSGGTYSLRSVAENPTCSIPGHALPQH